MTTTYSPVLRPRHHDASRRNDLSLDSWAALPEDVGGELVAGYLEEEELPDPIHELAITWLIAVLRAWLRGRGFVFGSDVKMAVSPTSGRKPDVSVYLPGGARPPRRGLLRTPPDIAVEVISPSPRDERRDRIEKMAEYAAFGIRWYWLLDPALGAFEIFELGPEGRYAKAVGVTDGVLAHIPGCPDLMLNLDDLWTDLERLGPEGDEGPSEDATG